MGIILQHEFLTIVRKKSFIITTVVIMLLSLLGFSLPTLIQSLAAGDEADIEIVAYAGETQDLSQLMQTAGSALGNAYEFVDVDVASPNELVPLVESGEYSFGIFVQSPTAYTRVVGTTNMYDSFDGIFSALMQEVYQQNALADLGLSPQQTDSILHTPVSSSILRTEGGKDAGQTFWFAYILVFVMYMVILMYGNMVATSVATEKSTRAMELLITSAKPTSLMFGKVFGASLAGFSQFGLIVLSFYMGYRLENTAGEGNNIIASIFSVDAYLIILMLVFLVLGFLIYAFVYAALASLVSRMEDLNTAVQPAMYLVVIAIFVVIFSMASGAVNNPVLVVCSFFPFTSPLAMFARVSMADVPVWEVALSIAILLASTIGIGILASAIYRLGVVLYGNTPKLKDLFKLMKTNKTEAITGQ